jgi:hypothetical protein
MQQDLVAAARTKNGLARTRNKQWLNRERQLVRHIKTAFPSPYLSIKAGPVQNRYSSSYSG